MRRISDEPIFSGLIENKFVDRLVVLLLLFELSDNLTCGTVPLLCLPESPLDRLRAGVPNHDVGATQSSGLRGFRGIIEQRPIFLVVNSAGITTDIGHGSGSTACSSNRNVSRAFVVKAMSPAAEARYSVPT